MRSHHKYHPHPGPDFHDILDHLHHHDGWNRHHHWTLTDDTSREDGNGGGRGESDSRDGRDEGGHKKRSSTNCKWRKYSFFKEACRNIKHVNDRHFSLQ